MKYEYKKGLMSFHSIEIILKRERFIERDYGTLKRIENQESAVKENGSSVKAAGKSGPLER